MRRGFVPRLDYRKVIICLVFLLCIWGVDSRKKKKASASGKAPGELLNEAFDLHKTSRFEEASTAYKAAIKGFTPAIDAGERSVVDTYALACHNLAYISHHGLSRTKDAEKYFKEATRVSPKYFEAYHNLGQVLLDTGKVEAAIEQFRQESTLRPDISAPLLSMAKAYHQLGDLEHAASFAKAATKVEPSSSSAWNGAGWFLHLAGRAKESAAVLKKGLALHPSDPAMHFHRGMRGVSKTFLPLGCDVRHSEILMVQRAGKALYDMASPAAAVKALKKSIALDPKNAEAVLLLGMARFDLADSGISHESAGLWSKCASNLEDAMRLGLQGNNYLIAVNHLSHARWQLGQHEASMALVWDGVRKDPDFCDLQVRRLQLQMSVCNYTEWQSGASSVHRLLFKQVDEGKAPTVNPFVQLVLDIGSPADRLHLARKFCDEKQRAAFLLHGAQPPAAGIAAGEIRPESGRKLRVGLMSADFRSHPMGHIIGDLLTVLRLEGESRALWSDIAVVAVSLTEDMDHVAKKVEAAADDFVRCGGMSDLEAAKAIRALELDVLVDLNGHTRGGRLRLLALELAPVQLHFQGFPSSMGASFVPWFITDPVVAPPELRGLYSEFMVYMPGCYHAYASSQNSFHGSTSIAPPPRNDSSQLIFDAQVNTDRIQRHMWTTWLRILLETGGVIRLRQGANTVREHRLLVETLSKSARDAGVDPDRLHFLLKVDSKAEHLQRLGESDLFLDTDAYSAHSTGLEALWGGLPILTFPSEAFASRPPSSFLFALQMPELVARNVDEYELLALKLARRRDVMQRWRAKLWKKRQAQSPTTLFHEASFLLHLQRALRILWDLRVSGKGGAESAGMHVIVAAARSHQV